MTDQQSQEPSILIPPFLLEIVPEDVRDADVAVMGEVGRSVIADLKQEGYTVHPVATGQRGALELLYEVMNTVGTLAGDAWQHKDILDTISSIYTIFVAASPIAMHLLYGKGKRPASTTNEREHDPEIQVSIKVDGAKIEVTSRDLENDERVRELAQRFLAAHPSVKVTPQSKVSIKGTVRKHQKRRR
jgi:aryl-alcohol dehydrogenase-like predicted oxidoreductase